MSLRRPANLLFHVLAVTVAGLLIALADRHFTPADWTSAQRQSVSPATAAVLARLDAALQITAYAPELPLLRTRIRALVARFQRERQDVRLRFVDPDTHPEEARRIGVSTPGELLLEYAGRSELLRDLDEEALTNAIQRLALPADTWLLGLAGHGEADLAGAANHDLGQFGTALRERGFRPLTLTLQPAADLPGNVNLLVLANPQQEFLPDETARLLRYLERGGNLLWLAGPDGARLPSLAQRLGLQELPGLVVDAAAAQVGSSDPTLAVVTRYPEHPVTAGLRSLSLFPGARAFRIDAGEDWQVTPLLRTGERSWNETGPVRGEVQRDPLAGEQAGPLLIGVALSRSLADGGEQRVAVIGDNDFLANATLGRAGNLDLGLNLVRWLTANDQLLEIPARTAPDLQFLLEPRLGVLLSAVFLLAIPAAMLIAGAWISARRRRQ